MTLSLACHTDLTPGLDPCKTPWPNWINGWCVGGCATMRAYTQKTISAQLSQVEPHHVPREGDCALTTGLNTPFLISSIAEIQSSTPGAPRVCSPVCETGSLVAQTSLKLTV